METNAPICLIKEIDETYLGDSVYISCYQKLCHFATGIFASEHRHISNNNLYLFRTSYNITSLANKSRSYLHITASCCGLEFQFLSVPTHSRLPSRSTRSTFYVPNPPSPLGYNRKIEWYGAEDAILMRIVRIINLCIPLFG